MGACISSAASHAARLKRTKEAKLVPTSKTENQSSGGSGGGGGNGSNGSGRRRSRHQIIVLDEASKSHVNIREKYQFGKELGRGEFGVTYLCTNKESGVKFACKTISKGKLKTDVDVEDVRREAEIMRRIPIHPNIVAFKEAFEDKEAVYLVMELCEGGELFDRIVARGHYTERAAADIVKTILNVVQVCHKHGVMHRDLKPENFLFSGKDENATLKAIDFGLSIFFKEGQCFNEIVGSPYYMAPEVLRRNYGPKADIWSAGVILYILLCGVPPFWAETEEGIAHAIVRGVIDFHRDPWPKVSEDAKDLVRKMLDQNQYDRLSIEEVIQHPWLHSAGKIPDVPLGENVMSKIKQFSLMNKFKKKVLRVVAETLPDEQVEKIKRLFHTMDTDKNGRLSFDELKSGLIKLGYPLSDSEVQMMLDAADFDGNGTLDIDEFLTITIHIKRMGTDEHLRHAFKIFDKNKTGFIEFDELREVLFEDGDCPSSEQFVHDIIFETDIDKDGRISFEEFKTMMGTGTDWRMSSRQYSKALLNALSTKMFKDKSTQLKS